MLNPAAVSLSDVIESGAVPLDVKGEAEYVVGPDDCGVWLDGACKDGVGVSGYMVRGNGLNERFSWGMGLLRTPYACEQAALVALGALRRVANAGPGNGKRVIFHTDQQGSWQKSPGKASRCRRALGRFG